MPIYPVYWQLEYPGGLLRSEPPEGETILHAPKGYIALRLIDLVGRPVQRVVIEPKKRPIFYRIRYVDLTPLGAPLDDDIHLGATVFGVGDDPEYLGYLQQGGTALWLWLDGQAVTCPSRLIDPSALNLLLNSPVGT